MRHKILILLAAVWSLLPLLAATVHAQVSEEKVFRFGIEDCIKYAVQHRTDMRSKLLEQDQARQDVRLYTSSGYPQVSASGTFSHNIEIQVFPIPAAFVGGPEGEFLFIQANPKNSTTAGINVRQLGFDGTFFIGLKAAKEYVELSARESELSEVNIASEVSKTYYSVLVNLERTSLLESSINQIDALLKDTRALVDNGFAEQLDLNRLQVNLTNTQTELANVRQAIVLSYNLLKFQMGMDIGARLLLTDKIDRNDFNPQLADTSTAADYRRRAEYRLLKQSIVMQDLAIRREQAGYWPTLYFNGNLSTQSFQQEIGKFFDTKERWFPFSTVGFTLSVPIFDGFRTDALIQKEKIERQKLDLQMEQFQLLVNFETANAKSSLANALRSLQNQQRNYELSQEVYRITQIKYSEGVGTNLEVVTADNERNQAQSNYVNALLEAYIAKIELQKALGTLYEPQNRSQNPSNIPTPTSTPDRR